MEQAPSASDGSAELARKVAQLEASLAQEKLKTEDLTQQLRQAKEHNVTVQLQAEAEEEAITLKLMRRLEQLKREKAMLATEVEQEEEFLTNTLQKRLAKVALEKEALEVKLLELKKQMDQLEHEKARLAKDKIDLEATLDSESEYIVNKLQVQLEKLGNEKKHLSREKSELQRQVEELGRSVEKLNRDKIKLEQEMEMEEESIVNRLQRQLELVLGSIRLIETKLEAKGMTMKDLGITPFEFAAPETLRIYSRSPSSASSVDRWHSPHNSQQLGSSPGGHTATSLGSRSHRPGGGYMRVSNDMMRVSAGGASGGGSMELYSSKPTSSGEITAGVTPTAVETAHSAPQMQTRRTSIGDVAGKV